MCNKYKKAFTLIELSVVLLVLAILVGAVLVSRKIIDRSRANAAITEFTQVRKAVRIFEDTYGNEIPGDISTDEIKKYTDLWAFEQTM